MSREMNNILMTLKNKAICYLKDSFKSSNLYNHISKYHQPGKKAKGHWKAFASSSKYALNQGKLFLFLKHIFMTYD